MATTPVIVSTAVEGLIDEAVMRRLVSDAGASVGPVYGKQGKRHLKRCSPGYNRAAYRLPWIVLVDLDRDAECAPLLRSSWATDLAPHMCFRVAVHEVEAWLMADREALAAFLGIPLAYVPMDPEAVHDPKETMVALARRSRRRWIREDMVPRVGSGRSIGPAYTSRLIEFAETRWRPTVAAGRSDSLRRCGERLRALVQRWHAYPVSEGR